MLGAAVFGAIPKEDTGFKRLDPSVVDAVWNEIGFSCELRHPEAVNDIGGLKNDVGRTGFSILATHWHMDFVGGDDAEVGVLDFPPPLVTDEANL